MIATPALLDPQSALARQSANALRGKVALITGGARGLGAAIARVLGESGMRIVLADVRAQQAQDLAASMAEHDIDAIALPLDLTRGDDCRECVAAVHGRYGRIDALVNNAGIDVTAPIGEIDPGDWERILATNLGGPFHMSQAVCGIMAAQAEGGHIVNITSTAAKRAWPNASAYHATKWGLLGLSHALHAELRPQGVKVCAIVAGGMRTPFLLERFPDLSPDVLQDPLHVARVVRFVIQQPAETTIPEVCVLPVRESSWP